MYVNTQADAEREALSIQRQERSERVERYSAVGSCWLDSLPPPRFLCQIKRDPWRQEWTDTVTGEVRVFDDSSEGDRLAAMWRANRVAMKGAA